MSTTLAQISGAATITSVQGDPKIMRRLAEMGLRTGSHIRVLYRTAGGGRVVSVGGARVALDAQLAGTIGVQCDGR